MLPEARHPFASNIQQPFLSCERQIPKNFFQVTFLCFAVPMIQSPAALLRSDKSRIVKSSPLGFSYRKYCTPKRKYLFHLLNRFIFSFLCICRTFWHLLHVFICPPSLLSFPYFDISPTEKRTQPLYPLIIVR